MFKTRKIRTMAKKDGKTFDDIAREYEEQGIEFEFAERKLGAECGNSSQLIPVGSDLETGLDGRKFTHSILATDHFV